MKVFWATDLHLNFASETMLNNFFNHASKCDALIISGDIGEGNEKYLTMLSDRLPNVRIFFVLGNHDYYGQSFNSMDKIVSRLCSKRNNLFWLTKTSNMINGIPIIGHKGWYDCFYGKTDYILLNDFTHIEDIKHYFLTHVEHLMIEFFRKLASKAAKHFTKSLKKVFKNFDSAILVTHVPPFKEVVNPCEEIWLPFTTFKLAGDDILEIMKNNTDKKLLVICGHTHSCSDVQILPNLRVMVGDSIYGNPKIYKDLKDLKCMMRQKEQ